MIGAARNKGNLKSNNRGKGSVNINSGHLMGNGKMQVPKNVKFTGATEGMQGNIFDCGHKNDVYRVSETRKFLATYVGSNMDNGEDIKYEIENLVPFKFPKSDGEGSTGSKTLPTNTEEDLSLYVKKKMYDRKEDFRKNKAKTFSIIVGQSTDNLRARLEAAAGWQKAKDDHDIIWLLQEIDELRGSM